VPEKFFQMYYPEKLDLPHDARFPNDSLHPSLRNFQDALNIGNINEGVLRNVIAAYQGMITCLDEMIGEILGELERQKMAENTYVIYTSDHGESLGEHGLFYKQCSYEASVGVPLIVTGPDVKSDTVIDNPVSLVDMYPTILEMAGLETEPGLPGTSWLPAARGDNNDSKAFVFSEHHGNFIREDWYMVVQRHFKYTHYSGGKPSLFNLRADPFEMNDLASNPEYENVLESMDKALFSVVNPEEISLRAKKDLGLIGPNGEDYTQTLSVAELEEGRRNGRFAPESSAI
jgi:choline-sulfatase